MTKFFQEKFQLTESGARGLVKSSITAFLYYFSFMPPLIIVLSFIGIVLEGGQASAKTYVILLIISALIMYGLTHLDYIVKYNETYKEAANLRIDLFDNLRKLPLSYFSKHDVSDLAQTIMADVNAMEHALSHAISSCIGFGAYFVLISVLMLINNYKMALCIILPLLLSVLLVFISKRRQISIRTVHYKKLRKISDNFQSAIELIQEIRSYGQKDRVEVSIGKDLKESEDLQWKSELTQVIPLSLAGNITQVAIGTSLFFGLGWYLQGEISLILLIGYTIAATKISEGVSGLFSYIGEIFYLDARIKRIGEIRNSPVQEGREVSLDKFDIELENVSFSYNPQTPVIQDLSFVARQNEVTALVGPSGCGKTTVLRLISRLYDYDGGSIKIGGHDIKEIDTECLFKYISIVFQDVNLFNTSILENIRIGDLGATDEEVLEAARLAGCDEIAGRLPQGYDTPIGEDGMNLSGGERQRISIARAFLKDAPIIILDEIAASLDVENEIRIQDSLNKLIKDKTVVIISHRLKSVENTDKIVVLKGGQVESVGSHKDLLDSSEVYRTMVKKSQLTEDFEY